MGRGYYFFYPYLKVIGMFTNIFKAIVTNKKDLLLEQAIDLIKKKKGLIDDDHRVGGVCQLTHVGILDYTTDKVLVGLIDGVVSDVNEISIQVYNNMVVGVRLSKRSSGSILNNVSLTMDERCGKYSNDPVSNGRFIKVVSCL